MLFDFTILQILLISVIFVWTGFVRSGFGFGGAALGLPLLLLIYDQPVFWLPIIGAHLLFFSALTLRTRIKDVGWPYLLRSMLIIVPSAIAGVFGLISLPNKIIVVIIYGITIFYALIWLFRITIHSSNIWVDRFLLSLGGVYSRHLSHWCTVNCCGLYASCRDGALTKYITGFMVCRGQH